MSTLIDLCDTSLTDKYAHSYLEVYETLFKDIKYSVKNLLEIGIHHGGSIKLWHDYFINANVTGIDCLSLSELHSINHNIREILELPNVNCHLSTDAYNISFINNTFSNNTFDMLIDDGPHTLESMIQFIKYYSPLMNNSGILIIEDIQSMTWLDSLRDSVPEDLKKFIKVYDLRFKKNSYDSVLFVINKNIS